MFRLLSVRRGFPVIGNNLINNSFGGWLGMMRLLYWLSAQQTNGAKGANNLWLSFRYIKYISIFSSLNQQWCLMEFAHLLTPFPHQAHHNVRNSFPNLMVSAHFKLCDAIHHHSPSALLQPKHDERLLELYRCNRMCSALGFIAESKYT